MGSKQVDERRTQQRDDKHGIHCEIWDDDVDEEEIPFAIFSVMGWRDRITRTRSWSRRRFW